MADTHPNVQRVMAGMQAFNAGDIAGAKAIYRDDMVYRVAGNGPLAGEYHGIDAYAEVVRRVRQESDGSMHFEPDVILADDHTVMMLVRTRGQRGTRTLAGESVYVFRFDEEGMCYEGRTIPVDQQAYDAFWS